MKDFFGNELVAGDEVVFIDNHYKYSFTRGKVVSFTHQKIRIEYQAHGITRVFLIETLKTSEQVIKVMK